MLAPKKGAVMLPNHASDPKASFRPFGKEAQENQENRARPDKTVQFNVATIMSAGSQALYNNIKAGERPCEDFSKFTDSKGNLIINDNLPLLDRRYRHIGLIGKGTFSQLLEAEDTLHASKRRVAIKVMRAGIAEYGEEESKYLSMLNSKDTLDSTHVVRMHKIFHFGAHYCLVLELLHSTLLDQLNDERKRRPTAKTPHAPPAPAHPPSTHAHSPPTRTPEPSTSSSTHLSTITNTPTKVSTRTNTAPSAPTGQTYSKSGKDSQELRGTEPTHGKRKSHHSLIDEAPASKKDRREMGSLIKQEPPSSPPYQNSNMHVNNTNTNEKAFLPIWFIRSIACQLIAAVGYLYQKGILHADLKPENIMFRENPYVDGKFREPYLKITDFGNAIALQKMNVYYEKYEVQSLSYRAPEVICGIQFGVEIEMWSIGCILAEMCNGNLLFHCKDKPALLHKMTDMLGPLPSHVYSQSKFYDSLFSTNCNICKNLTQFDRPDPFVKMREFMGTNDHTFVDLVVQLLHYDPKKRPTPQQALQHPFFAPLFTFSIFGNASRVESEIKRINSYVSTKVLESRKSATKTVPEKGCILFDEEKAQPTEAEPELEPPELERVSSELAKAKSDLARVQSELDAAQSEMAIYQANTRSQSGKLYDFAKITVNLKKEVSELAQLKQTTADLEKETEILRAELAKRDGQLPILVEENAKLKQRLAVRDLQGDLGLISEKKTQVEKQRLEKEIEQLRGKLEEYKKEADKHRATIKQLQKENGSKEAMEQLEKENARLQSEMAHLKQSKEEIATALNAAQCSHRKRVSELNEEKMDLIKREQDALKAIEIECERELIAAKESSELAEKLAARQTDVRDLEDKLAEMRKSHDGVEKTENALREARAQNATLRAQHAQATQETDSVSAKLLQLRKENAALNTRVKESESLKEELDKKGNGLTDLTEKYNDLLAINAQTEKEIGATKKKLQKMEKESEKLKEKVKKEIEKQKNRVSELEGNLMDKETELKQIGEERDGAAEKYAEAEKSIARLEQKLGKADENSLKIAAQAQKEQQKAQKEIARLKKENEGISKENEELTKDNVEIKKENEEIKKESGEIKKENAEIRKREVEAKKQLRESENEKKRMQKQRAEEEKKLEGEKDELRKERLEIEKERKEIQGRVEELQEGNEELEREKKKVQKGKETLEKGQVALKKEKEEHVKRKREQQKGEENLQLGKEELEKREKELERGEEEQRVKEEELNEREKKLERGKEEIERRERKIKEDQKVKEEDMKRRERELQREKEEQKVKEEDLKRRERELKKEKEKKAKEEDLKRREREMKQRERESPFPASSPSPSLPSPSPPSTFLSPSPYPLPSPSSSPSLPSSSPLSSSPPPILSPSPAPLSRTSRPASISPSPIPIRLPTPSPSPLPTSTSLSSSSLLALVPSTPTNEFFMAPSPSTTAKRFAPPIGRLPTPKFADPNFSTTNTEEDPDDVLLL